MTQPADYQRLYENLQMHCTGAIWPAFKAELFEVVRDFCEKTNIYRQVQVLEVSQASTSYTLTPPASASVKRILTIGDVTNQTPPAAIGTFIIGESAIGSPGYSLPNFCVVWPYGLVQPTTLQLFYPLNNTYLWQVVYTLFPIDPVDSDGNPVLPAWILDNYFDTFFSGVMYRMCMQKAKPYSDMALASTRYKMYCAGRGQAAADVLQRNVYNAQAWQYPPGGVVYGRQRGV